MLTVPFIFRDESPHDFSKEKKIGKIRKFLDLGIANVCNFSSTSKTENRTDPHSYVITETSVSEPFSASPK